MLRTRWMSPGGANPLTSPASFVLLPAPTSHSFALVEPEELLVLDALHHSEDAPGHVSWIGVIYPAPDQARSKTRRPARCET